MNHTAIEKLIKAGGVKKRTGTGADAILKLLKLCMTMTNFRFRNKHYALADGLPMGSPVIANIYMKVFEEKALATFPSTGPKVWIRFFDDVFSIVKQRHVVELLQHLNDQHPSIRFTEETERRGKLPFLDVEVSRTENSQLSMNIYRKPTHSARYLQYTSNHTDSAKRSVARALFERVQHVTRNEEKRKKNSGLKKS